MGHSSSRTSLGKTFLAATLVVAATGCWIVAGLDDRAPTGDPLDGATSDGDGATTDGPRPDALGDGGDASVVGCKVEAPFTGSRPLTSLNTPVREGAATLSPDELEIIFATEWNFEKDGGLDGGGGQLYRATRRDRAADFGDVQRLVGARLGEAQGSPTLTADGQTLYFIYYEVLGTLNPGVAVARKSTTTPKGLAFDVGMPMPAIITTPDAEDYVAVSPSGDELFLGRTIGTEHLLYHSTRTGGGDFRDPQELPTPPGKDSYAPVISADGLSLYFAAAIGNGSDGIYRMHRKAPGAFDPASVVEVSEVNEGGKQTPLWISPDLCRLYVSQSRAGSGILDLRVYEKSPP